MADLTPPVSIFTEIEDIQNKIGVLPQFISQFSALSQQASTFAAILNKILNMQNLLMTNQGILVDTVNKILKAQGTTLATQLAFELPAIKRRGFVMSNLELPNTWVETITIKATNDVGTNEPLPSGDTFTVSVSKPNSLNAVMGQDANGNPAVVMNALVVSDTGITVTVSDAQGLKAATQVVDIIPDDTPTNLVLDVADATHTTQAAPTATAGP